MADSRMPDGFFDELDAHLPPEQPIGPRGGRPRIGHRTVVMGGRADHRLDQGAAADAVAVRSAEGHPGRVELTRDGHNLLPHRTRRRGPRVIARTRFCQSFLGAVAVFVKASRYHARCSVFTRKARRPGRWIASLRATGEASASRCPSRKSRLNAGPNLSMETPRSLAETAGGGRRLHA